MKEKYTGLWVARQCTLQVICTTDGLHPLELEVCQESRRREEMSYAAYMLEVTGSAEGRGAASAL